MELKIGLKREEKEKVTKEKTALFLGSGGLPVYATPSMICLMEYTCAKSVEPYLAKGMGTVGILVNVSHLSATPLDMEVRCESELIGVEGKKLVFRVTAFDEKTRIGEGIHERYIIDSDKFLAKTQAK